ncbi:DUF4198 domain-containing protein [Bremerella sp. T1]|uniref:DUF4198 domain-containing protein n=1 Tax=Bremerella sp. TYQ1 TaxID=3119568 RepID=UPI001CCCDC74|nr:DUF4198 domain-containing protein [Bremerella volcania]UBM36108.1 DUF4198 domain-containing protein [Bremerella volcania]
MNVSSSSVAVRIRHAVSQGMVVIFGCLMVMLISGCGSEAYAPVSGIVNFDGQPLADAKLIFEPIGDSTGNSSGKPSYGKTDSSGQFSLRCPQEDVEGAAVGQHRVRIVTTKAQEYSEKQMTQAKQRLEKQEVANGNENPNVTDEMVKAYLSDAIPNMSKETLPAKYNLRTELKFTVESGKENVANFDLEGR